MTTQLPLTHLSLLKPLRLLGLMIPKPKGWPTALREVKQQETMEMATKLELKEMEEKMASKTNADKGGGDTAMTHVS